MSPASDHNLVNFNTDFTLDVEEANSRQQESSKTSSSGNKFAYTIWFGFRVHPTWCYIRRCESKAASLFGFATYGCVPVTTFDGVLWEKACDFFVFMTRGEKAFSDHDDVVYAGARTNNVVLDKFRLVMIFGTIPRAFNRENCTSVAPVEEDPVCFLTTL